jgi:1,4-dihydroxy-2-naphthoate octaprenyltransferase
MGTRVAMSDVLRIVEARTKIIGASSVVIGTGYAAWFAHHVDWQVFAMMLAGTLFIDLGTAGFNSYFDFVRGVDTVESDVDRYKVLVHRDLDPRVALWIAWGAFGLAGLFGLVLGARVGWEVVAVGSGCMVVAFFYSGGPWPIAATPVGEVFAGGLLGLVLVMLAAYTQGRHNPPGVLLVGMPSTVLIADILTVNNTCDIEGDRAAGRKTASIMLGPKRSRVLIIAMVAVAYGLAFALAAAHVLPVVSLVPLAASALLAARESGRMHRRGYSHQTKGASMGGISAVFLTYTAAIVAGLLLDVMWRSSP